MTKEGKDITTDMSTQLMLEKKAIEKDLKQRPIDMDMTKALILGLLLGIDKKPDEKDKLREDLVKVFAPEQNTGHWIGGDGHYICSCCRRDPLDFLEPLGLDGGSYMAIPMNYCPACGIKMAESEE